MRPRGVRVVIVGDDALPDAALLARLEPALAVARPGEVAVQLRDRRRTGRALLRLGAALRALTHRWRALLVVNDRVDLALALGADGVHLGGRSVDVADARALVGPSAIVSVAAHAPEEAARAAAAGASMALLSPIYASPRKGAPLGPAAVARAVALAPGLPIYGLGGVDEAGAAACAAAGAAGVAVIRSVLHAPDGARAMARLLTPFR